MIDVEMPGAADYARIARRWFDTGFSVIGPEQRGALEIGPKLPPEAIRRPMPSGPPGATWGFVYATRYSLKQNYQGRAAAVQSQELQPCLERPELDVVPGPAR